MSQGAKGASADDPLAFIAGDGEMKERTHSFDWSKTPVGPASAWPQSLKTVVRIMLDSRYAMWLGWGPDFTFFYNDAYARMTLGSKHPWALGRPAREVWSEIWAEVGPRAVSVVKTGKATWDEGLLLFLQRQRFKEETYHTFSYSPVPDDAGGVGGLLCVVTEDTERTIGERRLRSLRDLATNTTAKVQSAEESSRAAAQTIAGNPYDVPFALIYLLDPEKDVARLEGSAGFKETPPAAAASLDLSQPLEQTSWPLRAVLESRNPELITDLVSRFGAFSCGIWPEPPQQAYVLPLAKPGQTRLAGFVIVGISPRLLFDDAYKGFLDLLAGHIATAVANARVFEEERKRAEELTTLDRALRESEQRFRAVVETTPECVKIVSPEGKLLYMNHAGLCMVEADSMEAVLGAAVIEMIVPEYRDDWWRRHERVCRGERLDWQFEIIGARGTRRWMETHAVPLPLPDGRVAQLAVTRDITGRKRSEVREKERSIELEKTNARLQEEIEARRVSSVIEARLGALVESSDDAIVGKTLEGIITSWNAGAESLFGYTVEEAVGQSILLIVPEERHGEEADILSRLRQGLRINHFETQRRRKDGSLVDISLSVSPIRDSTGTIVGASKIARDITEKKRIEHEREQLLEAERAARADAQRVNRMKDEFLATLSHELRTPLNAIMGWAQLMGLGALSVDELKDAGQAIERNARTQKQLIDDLLDMSRIISGKLRLDLTQIDPMSFVEAAIETIRPSAAMKEIRIEKLLDPLAGPISGDLGRLQQVAWNLLSNAVKFTPKGGRVQVRLERVNSHIELSVSDTGPGIDPAFLPHLFERFRQADASTTRQHGGLGIGLAIVKEIVDLHGGSVRAKTLGEGNGAAFIVTLPLLVLKNASEVPRRHPTASSAAPLDFGLTDLSGLKVLFVDDEPDARALVKRLLEECGAEVTTAESAAQALERIGECEPSLLISDIGMPDLDGYEFLRELRRTGTPWARVPAIALTAFARSEDRTRALRAGYISHVAKPIEPSELLATIAVVAGRVGDAPQ